ncbi:MAG: hypothetical protein CL582_23420 [Alteromonadaceae bacterium]|nr:hypothetical protein [Alteromonadaceae bacterium]|tara:strand:- start:2012 stop:2194 length:183 start_codon:yes stop_codon:yes gene_type:complete
MRACIGGDLSYLKSLIEMYGLNTKIRTVWELEQERLSLAKFKKRITLEFIAKSGNDNPEE